MNRNLNRRIHPIAEANGLSPKFHRKRKDFIDNINDLSLFISLNGEDVFKSEKEETQVIDLLEKIFNILSK